jgi:hypothetical protein
VKASVSVTVLALNILLLMEGVLKVLGSIGVAAHAGVAANFIRPRDVDVDPVSTCRSGMIAGREL